VQALNPAASILPTTALSAWSIVGPMREVRPHVAVSTFSFLAQRAFDPNRLYAAIMTGWTGVVRSRGYFFVATQPDEQLGWSTAGAAFRYEHLGSWDQVQCQELRFIGQGMNRDDIEESLRDALVPSSYGPAGSRPDPHLADPFTRPLQSSPRRAPPARGSTVKKMEQRHADGEEDEAHHRSRPLPSSFDLRNDVGSGDVDEAPSPESAEKADVHGPIEGPSEQRTQGKGQGRQKVVEQRPTPRVSSVNERGEVADFLGKLVSRCRHPRRHSGPEIVQHDGPEDETVQ